MDGEARPDLDVAMTTSSPAQAGHVLHLNLNTADWDACHEFYRELFGLRFKMDSGSDDGDWRFHGIQEPVSSRGYFLYDYRGARRAPGLEVVAWYKPATAGTAYAEFNHAGATSLRLAVPPGLEQIGEAAARHGGAVEGVLDGGGLLLTDPDGVRVEVVADPALTQTRIDGIRVGCADLDTALAWYAGLGFTAEREPAEHEIVVGESVYRARTCPAVLPDRSASVLLTQWLDPVAADSAERRLWYRGMVRMAISVEDLDAAMAALAASGWEVPAPTYFALPGTGIEGLRVLFLNDPDGFTVELVHRPAEHFASKRPTPGATS